MNGVLYLAVVVAAFGSGLAQQTRPPPDPCRTCQILINIAYHHFNNTVNDKPGLLTQLQLECQKLAQYEGAQASADCTRIVNANIDTIYNDLNAQKSPQQTCMDIKECPAPMGGAPVLKRQKRQQPHTACNTCQIIIGVAKRHFNNNITDVNALKAQLDMECQALTQHGYTQTEADNCQSLVDANMNAIFMELQNNPTASPQKICQDLGQCTMVKRQKRQRPHDPCRICEIIVNIARHHFNNNITDENALKAELLHECKRLGEFEGQGAAQSCMQIVNNNIDKIFADMTTNKSGTQTCQDIKECPPSPSAPAIKRQKRQMPHDPCRTCQLIVNIAQHHFNNNVNDKNALLAQLLGECQKLAQFEGQAASQHCTQIVNANINTIFADMSTSKTALQTCTDIKECPSSSPAPVVKRQKRQRPHDPCRTCQTIVNIAQHHFNNNITDKAALQAQLLSECQRLAQFEGQAASQACTQLVNAKIDLIFADMSTGKTAQQTCTDLNECPASSPAPVVKRQKRQMPHDPCRTCELIINIARHHFNNNVNDQTALQTELLAECQKLAQFEGQAASQHCTQIVNTNIAQIFADMSTNKSSRQTCQDIKECPQGPVVKRQKRQNPQDQCRTCEIIINIAQYHFHNNINDQNALQQQLLIECQHLAQTEGPTASKNCINIVNANIAKIFADMKSGQSPRQTCVDIREC